MGGLGAVLGDLGAILGGLGAVLGDLGAILGGFGGGLGPLLEPLGAPWSCQPQRHACFLGLKVLFSKCFLFE